MEKKSRPYVKYAVLAIAVGLIAIGATNGEVRTVITKATNICLECIGIG